MDDYGLFPEDHRRPLRIPNMRTSYEHQPRDFAGMVRRMTRVNFHPKSLQAHRQRMIEAVEEMRLSDTVRVLNFTDLKSPFTNQRGR